MKSQIKTPSLNKLNILYNDFHKKQTVDSISKQNLVDDIMTDSTIIPLGTIVYTQADLDRMKDELKQQREQSDKLWLLFAKGLALFVVGYMAYHFIRFLMM